MVVAASAPAITSILKRHTLTWHSSKTDLVLFILMSSLLLTWLCCIPLRSESVCDDQQSVGPHPAAAAESRNNKPHRKMPHPKRNKPYNVQNNNNNNKLVGLGLFSLKKRVAAAVAVAVVTIH